MDWDAIYLASLPAWQTDVPPTPGIYRVLVTTRDYLTGAPLLTAERFARWTGAYWCCWGITPDRAALAYFKGSPDGYPWRPLDAADSMGDGFTWNDHVQQSKLGRSPSGGEGDGSAPD